MTGRPPRDPGDGHVCRYTGEPDVLGVRACVLCATTEPGPAADRVAAVLDLAGAPARLAARHADGGPVRDDLSALLAKVQTTQVRAADPARPVTLDEVNRVLTEMAEAAPGPRIVKLVAGYGAVSLIRAAARAPDPRLFPDGLAGSVTGLPLYVDADLPPFLVEARDADDQVVERFPVGPGARS